MVTLIPTYRTANVLSFAVLESSKEALVQQGVDLKRTSDFSFYLKKDEIVLHGSMGHEYGEVELSFAEPTFGGPLTSIISEMFQVDFEMEHNEEDH